MNVSRVKDLVRDSGGDVTDSGYTSVGRREVAYIEAYFEDQSTVPVIPELENDSETTVDTEWDPENNGVMYEVQVDSRS